MILVAALAAAACLAPAGDRITAGDVARAEPAFGAIAPALVLSHAPVPGAQRVFPPAELTAVLRRHGVEASVQNPVCFEWPRRTLTQADVLAAMQTALPGARIEIADLYRGPVPVGPIEFSRAGLGQPEPGGRVAIWKGAVRYTAARKVDIWAKVALSMPYERVLVTRPVRAGERLDASVLRLDSGSGFPQPPGLITRIEEAEGATARRLLTPGVPLRAADLAPAAAVSRGDVVRVEVLAGPARVSFTATAASTGHIGQFISVVNPMNRKTLRARVTGSGRAIIGAPQ